ncbi:antitoxin [Pseudomonas sp. 18.1.10]|uniref:type II toxin-antitoxin system RelB family antitoxin n=1 Tax=Pseudomonas sp. 18.1.10 TaxID=2969302 RepID=UPI002150281B|nr:antitoxin [Pseudomonas sp. 18.1.10]MCR4538476.1 antitoxin [Pseudomonas sp. 18.1.10]
METEFPDPPEVEDCASSYELWFRAKVQATLDDTSPGLSHEQVMHEMHVLIAAKLPIQQSD